MTKRMSGAALAAAVCLFAGPVLAEKVELSASALNQIKALRAEKAARTPTQKKIDSRLLFSVYKQRRDARLAAVPSLRIAAPRKDGRVLVDIDARPTLVKGAVAAVEAVGGQVTSASMRYSTVRAYVPLASVETIAADQSVRRVGFARQAMTHKINTSEGDIAHGAVDTRSFFGVDGAGQKVCVLSDGVTSLAAVQASGDLPAVDVLPGQAGSGDEGTAMLEIVHDLAPGAALGFASAFESEEQFAQNILDLATSGCTVIVDDVIYFDEPPFQDGLVAQSVNTVTASGVEYFSSAGNEGNANDGTSGTWEGNFTPNGDISTTNAGVLGPVNDFGDGGQSILVTGHGPYTVLHWADPWGQSDNDYDIYDLDGTLTTVFDASTNTQDGDDNPFEIYADSFAGERIVIAQFSGEDRAMNLILFRGQLDSSRATAGATRGHSAATAAYSVAAVDATLANGAGGVFDGSEPVEWFSSDGPRSVFYDAAGDLLPSADPADIATATVRAKPDIAAADGVATAAPGFNPFYGTSAAAPHAAAIAALVKQAFPSYTAADLRTALTGSALDIEAPGSDRDSGAGIVMPYPTLLAGGAVAGASLTATSFNFTQAFGNGDSVIDPGETWDVSVTLQNTSAGTATAISGLLSSSSPGVTITQASSAYPDLTASDSAVNTTAFRFTLGSSAACGPLLEFTLTASYSGGPASSKTFAFTHITGGIGSPSTFAYTTPAVAIPDSSGAEVAGATATASLTVAGLPGNVADLDFSIDGSSCNTTIGSTTVGLDHTFVGDLVLQLESPAGTKVSVVNRLTNGGGGNGGNNFCQTVLDDESAGVSVQGLASASAPFTGNFKPASALSTFDGEAGNGTWKLNATDYFIGDTGSIRAFSLSISPAVCNVFNSGSFVTVTAPDTAVVWQAGTTKQIKFIHNLGKNKPVKIEINRDYPGGSWDTIATTNTTAAKNSTYNWLVSGFTSNARIRVTSVDTGATDTGNATFSITKRVKVTQPNGAATWKVGTTKVVKWTHNYPVPATFEIKLDNNDDGVCETLIKNSVNAATTTGSYSWKVAGSGSTNKVCVNKLPADPDGADRSDATFTINP